VICTISPEGSLTLTVSDCAAAGIVREVKLAAKRDPAASRTVRSRVFMLAVS
jgi:hypothetical protein